MKITCLPNNPADNIFSWSEIKNTIGRVFKIAQNICQDARFISIGYDTVLYFHYNQLMIADATVWHNYTFKEVQDKITIEFNENPA